MSMLRLLRNYLFTSVLIGQTLSCLGDGIYRVALAWWVLEKTGSATVMSTLLIFSFVPTLLFLLMGGVASDRFSRVSIMLMSDLLRGLVVLILAVLVGTGQVAIWPLYIASVVLGVAEAFFQPAYTSLVPEIVSCDLLTNANALVSLSKQISKIIGPALGALIISHFGILGAFALNGVSFFVSALFLAPLLNISLSLAKKQLPLSWKNDLIQGFTTVAQVPWVWITIMVAALGNITISGPIAVALPFLIKTHVEADVRSLGFVYSMLSLGSFLSIAWLGRSVKLRRRGAIAYAAWMLGGGMILVIGLPISILSMGVAAIIFGGAMTIFSLIWTTTLQELIPREKLGRVSSIDSFGSYMLLPVGYGVIGLAITKIGPSMVFIVSGIITVGLGMLALTHRAIRGLD